MSDDKESHSCDEAEFRVSVREVVCLMTESHSCGEDEFRVSLREVVCLMTESQSCDEAEFRVSVRRGCVSDDRVAQLWRG